MLYVICISFPSEIVNSLEKFKIQIPIKKHQRKVYPTGAMLIQDHLQHICVAALLCHVIATFQSHSEKLSHLGKESKIMPFYFKLQFGN